MSTIQIVLIPVLCSLSSTNFYFKLKMSQPTGDKFVKTQPSEKSGLAEK